MLGDWLWVKILWIDSESSCLRLTGKEVDDKNLLDVRVNRLLAWVRENVPESQLQVKFVPGEFNSDTDPLSRWTKETKVENREDWQEEMVEGESEKLKLNSSDCLSCAEEIIGKQLHVGLKAMEYRSQV